MLSVKEYTELKKLLECQDCARVPREIYHYAKAQHSLFCLVCDVFNYGYIMRQRVERARRKGGARNA